MSEEQRRVRMKPVLDRIPDHWGKYLPDAGWDEILLKLDLQLAALDPDYEIHQAKEKFGTLRFYYSNSEGWDGDREKFYNLVNQAEEQSVFTCEVCGAAGAKARNYSWIKTLCDEHARKEEGK